GYSGVLPLQPASGVDEGAVLFRESRTRQAVDDCVDVFHIVFGDSGSSPEFAGLVREDFAYHEPIGFLQSRDILFGAWTDRHTVHSEGEQTFDLSVVHSIPHLYPRVAAIDFGKIVESEVILFFGRIAAHSLQKRNHSL